MVYIPLAFLVASGLLARTSLAIPVPVITEGQVIHVAPAQTDGQYKDGRGANVAHPHIVLGQENGKTVLAPVTSPHDAKNGPSMKFGNEIHPDLKPGSILLSHVTADPASLPHNPNFGGAKAHDGAIQKINDAKFNAAIDSHASAGDAHIAAAKAHENAAKAHDGTAKQYANNFANTAGIEKEHKDKAADHRNAADAHWTEGLLHHSKAASSDGPMTYDQHNKIQGSKNAAVASGGAAKQSGDHAKAASEHIKAGVAAGKAGNQVQSFQHIQEAQKHAPSRN